MKTGWIIAKLRTNLENIGIITVHDVNEVSVSPIKTSITGTRYRDIKIDDKEITIFYTDDSDCLLTLENENE